MQPQALGQKYDKIAHTWQQQHLDSNYGVEALNRALQFCPQTPLQGQALDVGCGAGGRLIQRLQQHHFHVSGIDVSETMIALARKNHPEFSFWHQDICHWHPPQHFDFILAWDSLFHLPLAQQQPVLEKLCRHLKPGGVLLYTFGHDTGEHTDQWHEDTFYYSSIGIQNNLKVLLKAGLTPLHLELDQHPYNHVYLIATH